MRVRYMEVDAQHVVFNGWYLTYFDEAMAAFLAHRGLPYATLLAAGYDAQLIHTEVDWKAGLRWQDDFVVTVSTARIGRTSFALDFETRRGIETTSSARTVYVVVATDGSGKQPIPPLLALALEGERPDRPRRGSGALTSDRRQDGTSDAGGSGREDALTQIDDVSEPM